MIAFSANPLPVFSSAGSNVLRACAQSLSTSMPIAGSAATRQRAFWVEPCAQEALTAALEGGVDEFLFRSAADAERWAHLGRFTAHVVSVDGRFDGGVVRRIDNATDAATVAALAGTNATVVLDGGRETGADGPDWRVIPAETFWRLLPERRHSGVDGVVLRAKDPAIVHAFLRVRDDAIAVALQERDAPPATAARVTGVTQVGAGMRVCVDTCSLFGADEGILVGSSSQRLFVVLSEAARCDYIASRPFRVNAGAVHSYIAIPGGRTRY
eukprot:IDg5984t1